MKQNHHPAIFILLFFWCGAFFAAPARAALSFSGKNIATGETISFRSTDSSKASVLVFLSARCPCSASHESALKTLAQEFSGKGFRFLAVHSNADENAALAQNHFQSSSLPFPIIEDSAQQKVANALGALKTPHVFVIDPQGAILYSGGVDETHFGPKAQKHYLWDALTDINEGHKPRNPQTMVLGCAIKRN